MEGKNKSRSRKRSRKKWGEAITVSHLVSPSILKVRQKKMWCKVQEWGHEKARVPNVLFYFWSFSCSPIQFMLKIICYFIVSNSTDTKKYFYRAIKQYFSWVSDLRNVFVLSFFDEILVYLCVLETKPFDRFRSKSVIRSYIILGNTAYCMAPFLPILMNRKLRLLWPK